MNNAAIAFKGADPTPFEGQTGPTLRTNYKGTVALTERMLPLLEKSANGNLVNIASMAGRLGQVSGERQAQFTSPTLTTGELTKLADEFAADVAAGRHKANGWGNSNCVVPRPSRYAIDATSLAARPPRRWVQQVVRDRVHQAARAKVCGHRAQRELLLPGLLSHGHGVEPGAASAGGRREERCDARRGFVQTQWGIHPGREGIRVVIMWSQT